jgi:zinc transporter ZupT
LQIADFAILLRAGFSRWEAAKAQFGTAFLGMCGASAALIAGDTHTELGMLFVTLHLRIKSNI